MSNKADEFGIKPQVEVVNPDSDVTVGKKPWLGTSVDFEFKEDDDGKEEGTEEKEGN